MIRPILAVVVLAVLLAGCESVETLKSEAAKAGIEIPVELEAPVSAEPEEEERYAEAYAEEAPLSSPPAAAAPPVAAPAPPARASRAARDEGETVAAAPDAADFAPLLISSASCIDSEGYGSIYDCVELFFGTNREEVDVPSGQVVFGGRAAGRTELGNVTVTVPIDRLDKPGSPVRKLGNVNRTPNDADREDNFTIWGWDSLDENGFITLVREELTTAEDYENSALVFVHGFNVTFRSAAFRAAQMKFDMRYDGPTFFFSWPANGSTLAYLSDQDDADISVEPLAEFLMLVKEAVGEDTKIYLVAHSMGTRLTAQALYQMSLDPALSGEPFFERTLFAAGDLDRALFRRWVEPARDHVGELTIYTSQDDKAVSFSTFLRTPGLGLSDDEDRKTRIGLIESYLGPTIVDWAKTVDITEVNSGILSNFFGVNHADYVESEVTIADLEDLIRGASIVPEERNPDFLRRCYDGKPYWRYEKDGGENEDC